MPLGQASQVLLLEVLTKKPLGHCTQVVMPLLDEMDPGQGSPLQGIRERIDRADSASKVLADSHSQHE